MSTGARTCIQPCIYSFPNTQNALAGGVNDYIDI